MASALLLSCMFIISELSGFIVVSFKFSISRPCPNASCIISYKDTYACFSSSNIKTLGLGKFSIREYFPFKYKLLTEDSVNAISVFVAQ